MNFLYLDDLRTGDFVICRKGMLWDLGFKNSISHMVTADGMRGIVLYADGEDLFLMTQDRIVHFIDHYNMPTRWEVLEE